MRARFAPLMLAVLSGCLHGNIAPTAQTEVSVRRVGAQVEVSWPQGRLTELRLGQCEAACAEEGLSDPSSEFSEMVPMPIFSTLRWHLAIPEGVTSPLLLGTLPAGATELVPFEDPTSALHGVSIVVEVDRGDGVLERFGAATLP